MSDDAPSGPPSSPPSGPPGPPATRARVTRNPDGTDHVDRRTDGIGGWVLEAPLPVASFAAPFDVSALQPLDVAGVFCGTIHALGRDERQILLALGGDRRSIVWIGTPDGAEQIVRELQFCIGRARALMAGGGTA